MTSRFLMLLRYVLLTILAVLVVYPLWYAFSSAVLPAEEASMYPPPLLPSRIDFSQFRTVLDTVPITQFLKNSFIVSLLIMLGHLVLSAMAAYAFAFISFRGKAVWFAAFLSTMMIPWEVTVIPNYLTIKSWGWMDSYAGLTVPFLASAFGTFLLRQFFLQLPRELFDAARMDGCGHARTFLSIVLPLSRPALATLGVYSFLQAWNMYLWPLLITNSVQMRTVQIGISMLKFEEATSWSLVLAGVAIVLLPSLLLLAVGLKQLVRGIAAGAVKG